MSNKTEYKIKTLLQGAKLLKVPGKWLMTTAFYKQLIGALHAIERSQHELVTVTNQNAQILNGVLKHLNLEVALDDKNQQSVHVKGTKSKTAEESGEDEAGSTSSEGDGA